MAALAGLTTIKRFSYRGDPTEEFSNQWHFRNAPPATSAEWKVMADGFIAHEKTLYRPETHIVRAYGYADDSAKPISVWSYDYLLAGEEVPGTNVDGGELSAGDQAALMWWRLDHKNSRGKWVYLRKYLHDAQLISGGGDELFVTYRNTASTFQRTIAGDVGMYWGGLRARTGDWPVLVYDVSPYITTRTLRRRGKRPLAHP